MDESFNDINDTKIENNNSIIEYYKVKMEELLNLYKNNDFMLKKMNYHLNMIPNLLEIDFKNYEKKMLKHEYLSKEQELFIKIFLNKYQYYYLSPNMYYIYDGKNYHVIKEDDIRYNLLSSITSQNKIMEWKHKTKHTVMKIIKEQSLFKSVPESKTIQQILRFLVPVFFQTKNEAKYFLTIIGDNILKKNENLHYLIHPNVKKIIEEICYYGEKKIGCYTINHNFTVKYHKYNNYNDYRLIKINNDISSMFFDKLFSKLNLNFLCVAVHYSNRFESADHFINTKADLSLKNYVCYLKNNTQEQIIDNFIENSLEKIVDNKCNYIISWKNMHYIWSHYLITNNFPNIIYLKTLKNLLKEKINYNEEKDIFCNITSKYLPSIKKFLNFWDKYIIVENQIKSCEHSNPKLVNDLNKEISDEESIENTIVDVYSENVFINEFEVEELYHLFKKVEKNIEKTDNKLELINISYQDIIQILKHYFPHVKIIDDKYILNIYSSLWDKKKEIDTFLESFRLNKKNYNVSVLSFFDLYKYYISYNNKSLFDMNNLNNSNYYVNIVNKNYFIKYVKFVLSDYIEYDLIILDKWLNNEFNDDDGNDFS
jgi:uncharacterized protein Usg